MKRPSHILVIRLSAMGDVAMTVPVLMQLLDTYPKLKITVLTKPFFAHLFEHIEGINVVKAEVKTKHKGISGLWLLAKQLHKLDIDSIADLHNVLRSRILCGFLKILGHDYFRIDKGRAEKKALTRPNNKVLKPLNSSHQRYADVFKKLKLPLDKKFKIDKLQLPISSEVESHLNLDETKKWIGIAPFAAHSPKQYPLKLMKKAISKLSKEDNIQIYLFGGGKKEIKKLKELAENFENCENIAGKFSFSEELQLISNLDIMLSMDSGNGHLAAMFGVDVITIWGATHPYAGFAPFGQTSAQQLLPNLEKYPLLPTSIYGNKKVKGYKKVMHDITPEEVFRKVKFNLV
ncbi:glycosyltransferase family 9 protein [Psychroflexus montanilacus]|uniref:glycosyltransferase family 9 protein n=1 Tax=Psychroflexus montanilacus TaxID=2873598 RepID=UPI001CCCCE31|nr:glycosyltransferase family 9 protein [Psychroflexus montanilacus]MBZ9652715.1 glycosyltransferase family 9 protein [Psychroflexus montanilacus]